MLYARDAIGKYSPTATSSCAVVTLWLVEVQNTILESAPCLHIDWLHASYAVCAVTTAMEPAAEIDIG